MTIKTLNGYAPFSAIAASLGLSRYTALVRLRDLDKDWKAGFITDRVSSNEAAVQLGLDANREHWKSVVLYPADDLRALLEKAIANHQRTIQTRAAFWQQRRSRSGSTSRQYGT